MKRARLSALGSRLSALGSRLSALGSRLSALGSRLSALGSRLSALGSRLSALGSRLSALGSRLSALGSRLSALGSRLSASLFEGNIVKPFPNIYVRLFVIGPQSWPSMEWDQANKPARSLMTPSRRLRRLATGGGSSVSWTTPAWRPPRSGNGASFHCLEPCMPRQPPAPGLGRQPAATIAMRRRNGRYGMQKAACDRRYALTASRNVPHRKRPGVCCRLAIAGRAPRATAQYTISKFCDGANFGTQRKGRREEGGNIDGGCGLQRRDA